MCIHYIKLSQTFKYNNEKELCNIRRISTKLIKYLTENSRHNIVWTLGHRFKSYYHIQAVLSKVSVLLWLFKDVHKCNSHAYNYNR